MKMDSSKLRGKLSKISVNMEAATEKALLQIGKDIAKHVADKNSVTWVAPTSEYTGQKYFSGKNTPDGLFKALKDVKNQVSVSKTPGGKMTLVVGDATKLTTMFPWWDLFEGSFGVYRRGKNVRAGSSSRYGFIPAEGYGKYEQGFSYEGGTRRGVLPSHMFRDTFKYFRAKIRKDMKGAITKTALKMKRT